MKTSKIQILMRSLVRGSFLGVIISLFLFLLLTACQTLINKRVHRGLMPYVTTFLDYCNLYKTDCSSWKYYNIEVQPIEVTLLEKLLGQGDKVILGQCNTLIGYIHIQTWWYERMRNRPEDIESLMFHELAHCVLNKDHTDENKYSIMNPYGLDGWSYKQDYNKYINELFGCTKDCPVVKFQRERYIHDD